MMIAESEAASTDVASPVCVGYVRLLRWSGVEPVTCCRCGWTLQAQAWLGVERDASGAVQLVWPMCEVCASGGAAFL